MATSSWCVLVLRAWRDQDGLRIRLLSSSDTGHATAVVISVQSACEHVASYLVSLTEPDDRPLVPRRQAMTQVQENPLFTEKLLPTRHDAVAPDGSLVRLLPGLVGGSMAHFELGAGEVSRPLQHRTVSEIWYVVQGLGRMWRRQDGLEPREIELRAGIALTIPVGTSFQFRNTGREPLAAIGVTMPPWPGEDEAMETDGPWTPNLRGEE
jgi:mannose-6-phosphate isomerase-like protein (cupin superfamily)